jgi:protein transport protein SEC31
LGNNAARTDDIDCLAWNKKVPHILVTGSSAGFVTVWDVKTKKESLTLNNKGRKPVSAVAWDPARPTKLITSTPHESDPVLYVWDLRNSHEPERILSGHESGVLSLSWCDHDPDLLLSSGKDNRNICWNPQTGQAYGEFPVVTNWTFQTRWNPHNPNFFATASFDGKICIQTLQNTKTDNAQAIADHNQALDGEDFFAKAQTQPQVSKFSLPKAPRWLERPCGVTFGFGGRVVSFSTGKDSRVSKIKITPFEVDESVGNATESFETALKEGDIRSLCEARASNASTEAEKADWKVMQALISQSPRKDLVEYLGFNDQADEAADSLSKLGLDKKEGDESSVAASKPAGAKKHKRLQSMFDPNPEGDSFLSELAASKGAQNNNPFQIFNGSESEAEKQITRSLLLGEFEKALDVAIREDKMADAFMIAICGGPKCVEKAQEYYFSKQTGGPNYMRLLASIVGKNLWDVVHNADLSNWKEVMAALCTFADEKEFPDLCDALGDRLQEQIQISGDKSARKDASFCFLAGSKLEKVVAIWVEELRENEQKVIESNADNSSFSVHVRALQGLIEKVTIFRQVTKFQDTERTKDSEWTLSVLYDKYVEYADVVAGHGRLQIAQKYLDLVPEKYPEAELARNRIKFATRQAPQKPLGGTASKAAFKALPQQPNTYQPASTFTPAAATPPVAPLNAYGSPAHQQANPYGPPPTANSLAQPPNPYASIPSGGAYNPGSGYQPTQGMRAPGYAQPSAFGAQPAGAGVPPPPRASANQSPAKNITTYTTATGLPAWNDLPEGFAKAPTPRRSTPAAATGTIASPFPSQSPTLPQAPPQASGPRAPSVPPPPKAGSVPPPRMMSPASGSPGISSIPGPSPPPPANPYASLPQSPPLVSGSTMAPPASIPRGASPYNAPPNMPPPTNRYTPSPAPQSAANPPVQARGPVPPPPQASASPYAPQAVSQPPANPYAPTTPIATQPPPMAQAVAPPPQGPRPGSAQLHRPTPPAPKYREFMFYMTVDQHSELTSIPAPGDRSHIPANAQPIFEILSADMERVKLRAPAAFKQQVDDAERRLSILFDHLNNEDLLKPNTVEDMANLARAIQNRDYATATSIHLEVMTNRTDECGNWMVSQSHFLVECVLEY